ncbi:hypothetical protein EC844_111106 [Acinetobacter calcoaceticus]|uniref:Uncharacterized protein n=1 Tax=Acinetobacter calcoaceticus TaxID=471 RepID=A0A4R1XSH5_ACICA|nr:hypothetical protein EC844_111106 [Acinetobacter calcoaceticus]
MKLSLTLSSAALLTFSSFVSTAHAELLEKNISTLASAQPAVSKSQLKLQSDVKVNMQRMLRSTDGQYFLELTAGIWNPSATLTLLNIDKMVRFEGLQKGNQLNLSSVVSELGNSLQGEYQLSGNLNANSGNLNAQLLQQGQGQAAQIAFEPAFKVKDKPTFVFKFYGKVNPQTQQNSIQWIDVIDKQSQKIIQSLNGFSADTAAVDYMDINFDGYYDLVLADTSSAATIAEQRHIYWMYNPRTGQYQRSPQMEKVQGFPNLDGVKQQIDFGNGQIYQVEKGLLKRLL